MPSGKGLHKQEDAHLFRRSCEVIDANLDEHVTWRKLEHTFQHSRSYQLPFQGLNRLLGMHILPLTLRHLLYPQPFTVFFSVQWSLAQIEFTKYSMSMCTLVPPLGDIQKNLGKVQRSAPPPNGWCRRPEGSPASPSVKNSRIIESEGNFEPRTACATWSRRFCDARRHLAP